MAREDLIVHGERRGVDIPGGGACYISQLPRKEASDTQPEDLRPGAHPTPPTANENQARYVAKFDTVLQDLPSLCSVQNFVHHYSRTHLKRNDRVDDLRMWIHERAFTGREELSQPFTYAWDLDGDGKPVVGNGSEERPFVVGLTTKTLMLRLMRPPESFVLHVDATYKLNYRGYPVIVIGISDSSRGFHLVSMFIVSGETQDIVQPTLMALRRLFFALSGHELVVQYAMADADQAQYNAVNAVFGSNPRFTSLMCFFHVMQKVYRAISAFPSDTKAIIVRDLYDMHFARSHMEFVRMRDDFLSRLRDVPELIGFAQYMSGQWLTGRYSAWQLYWTPTGFASTNNPVETFNAVLKRDYTLRRRLKMGALLQELSNCCQDKSASERLFSLEVVASPTLVRRVSEMIREKLLYAGGLEHGEIASAGCIRVVYCPAKRILVSPNNRSEEGIAVTAQMGVNYARMEFEGQPYGGWVVDTARMYCQCSYWFGFGVCVHVLFAQRTLEYLDCSGREILVTRGKQKNGAPDPVVRDGQRGRRPLGVGPALTY
ncbi:hypothetical protein P3T76_000457 [Phytophthora citrophthora]|uniref:MULE transposase domain-containing protein n=1 Tax=Phytophthora citrophthora TaxID=4793 RepID=A0AAD9LG55_9STRA|nr:hypothetical protein P3T76_010693 [Phytophthora citrophthora]KAK1948167.1 hypothetical protein P3T76_000457 [Phytophthora citrophthora]